MRRSPVAEVIDADDSVADGAKEVGEGAADNGRANVVIGEVLGDIGRRKVDADGFAGAGSLRDELAVSESGGEEVSEEGASAGAKIQERTGGGRALEEFSRREGGGGARGERGGRGAEAAGGGKTADREVPELGARRRPDGEDLWVDLEKSPGGGGGGGGEGV